MRGTIFLLVGATLLAASLAGRLPGPVATAGPNWFHGDANCDGSIDSRDARDVLKFEAGLLDELPNPDGADPNEDGSVDSRDARLILQFNAGLVNDRIPDVCLRIAGADTPVGDVDCSGATDSLDSLLILQLHAALLDSLPCEEAADVNEDGSVNSIDALLIIQFGVRPLEPLPP